MNTALEVVFVLAVILGLIAIAAGVLWFAREEGWELPEPLARWQTAFSGDNPDD